MRNGAVRASTAAETDSDCDFRPVVKLFTPDGQCTWLLTELDPEHPDIAYGLCDLGLGEPEIGWVSLSELESLRGRLGLAVERDQYFAARHRLSVYARAARANLAVTEGEAALEQAALLIAEEVR